MKKANCNCNFEPKDFLFFNRLIMPQILTFIYWIVLVVVVLGGLFTMFSGAFFSGLLGIIIGAISVRISFEMICVVFSINRNLEKLVALQENQSSVKNTVSDIVEDVTSDEEPKAE